MSGWGWEASRKLNGNDNCRLRLQRGSNPFTCSSQYLSIFLSAVLCAQLVIATTFSISFISCALSLKALCICDVPSVRTVTITESLAESNFNHFFHACSMPEFNNNVFLKFQHVKLQRKWKKGGSYVSFWGWAACQYASTR